MKVSMEVKHGKALLLTLKHAKKGLTRVFKDGLKDEAVNMKLFAQAVLSRESQMRTGKKYWTGTLLSAIKTRTIEDKPGSIHEVIEVDLGVTAKTSLGPRVVKDYAIPVEKGHKVGFRESWKGYHYMEQTYIEFAPKIEKRMAGKISKVIRTPWRLRDIATGRWAPESTPKHLIQKSK